jgi:class 3 adenylate cyclase
VLATIGDPANAASMRAGGAFTRRLAAIAFADVVGFSGRIEADDVGAMRQWQQARVEVIEPLILAHAGQLVRVVGDGLLIEFGSVIDALRWAIAVQRSMAGVEPGNGDDGLALRIAINVDDVLVSDGELHGDGVNVAARIHQLAGAGEIVVTAAVRDYATNRIEAAFEDLGERRLKNISHPVRISRVVPRGARGSTPISGAPVADVQQRRRLPAVAVLPFYRLGPTAAPSEVDEGITEDVTGALTRSKAFCVISSGVGLRGSPEGRSPAQGPHGLGARFLLGGTVRQHVQQLRVTAKLTDATTGSTLWADHFDGELANLVAFQDDVVSSIVATIETHVIRAESARAEGRCIDELDAYDCVMRSLPIVQRDDRLGWDEAAALLTRAIELDPFHARAHAYRAWLDVLRIGGSLSSDVPADSEGARKLVDRAMLLEPDDPFILAVAAHVYSFLHSQPQRALALIRRAVELTTGRCPRYETVA